MNLANIRTAIAIAWAHHWNQQKLQRLGYGYSSNLAQAESAMWVTARIDQEWCRGKLWRREGRCGLSKSVIFPSDLRTIMIQKALLKGILVVIVDKP
jgi:hypothetical protein